jgi:hypothetical protein
MSHLWATFEWITVLQNVDLAIFFFLDAEAAYLGGAAARTVVL